MKKIKMIIIVLIILVIIYVSIINLSVIIKSNKYIDKNIDYNNYKYVLVLGARVNGNDPSLMLKDRLDKVVEIYNKNNNINIIVSGDSKNKNVYDEVTVMYNYLVNKGVNSLNIIKDENGLSTYDSIIRIKDIVDKNKMLIVTQKYHLYRSVYIAKSYDIDVVGVSAKDIKYYGESKREVREILARVKDYIYIRLKVKVR